MHISELCDELKGLISANPELQTLLGSVKEKAQLAKEEHIELLKKNKEYFDILEKADDLISLVDEEGRILYANQRWEIQLGEKPEDVLGQKVFQRFGEEDSREISLRILEGVFERKEHHFGIENLVRHKDGNYYWHLTNLSPILGENGKVKYALAISRDNHLHKLKDIKIAEKEYRMRLILENMQEGIIVVDNDDKIQYVNSGLCKMFGYGKEDLIGKIGYEVLMTPESATIIQEKNIERMRGIASKYEVQGIRKTGESIRLGASGSPLRGEDGTNIGSLGILNDITERYKYIEALRESEERFRLLYERSVAGIFHLIIGEEIKGVNPAFAKFFGYNSVEELLALKMNVKEMFVHQKDIDTLTALLRKENRVKNYEAQMRKKDGSYVWMSINARLVNKSGTDYIEGICVDITEKKSLREQLTASQTMDILGKLSAEISHSFNDLLTVILGYSEDLLEFLNPNMPLYEPAEEIMKAAMRAAELTRRLLSFSLPQSPEPKELNLNYMLNSLYRMIMHFTGSKVKLEYQLMDGLPPVVLDARQMEQLLLNIFINARDAMPEGGEIMVRSSVSEIGKKDEPQQLKPGRYVTLSISDNGMGMDADTLKHLFEPFFTTKKEITGLGLGLASAYRFVHESGGTITAQSEAGKGTTMTIWLPVSEESAQKALTQSQYRENRGKGQRILVVDDEETIGKMIQKALTNFGYQVDYCGSSQVALRRLQSPEPYDLVILDLVMPSGEGKDLAEKIKKNLPAQKILYMSGFANELIAHQGVLEPGISFIQKPFSTYNLLKELAKILA